FNQQQPGIKKRMVTKKNDFAIPEMIPVKCDIHGWMKAWIVVVDHPYHAVTDEAGAFKITGIPAGTYTVEFWHETLGKQTQEVTVKDGANTEVNAVLEPRKK
ncbi:MAG: carboxypeptidase regulatory-like domain-containing protein, partial [bacterium]